MTDALRTAAQAALEALHPAQAALNLLQSIRCHPRRHDLEREWLSEADKVIGYWDDIRAVSKIESAQEALRAALAQPQQQPPLTPLASERIKQIELGLRIYSGDVYDLSLLEFARALERAHGIIGDRK
jgi:hypothetical protein